MLERIEVRFNPTNAEEGALVALLESQSDYGAKGRFLKARLLRGYVTILREVESIRAETDPLAALARVAQSVNAGHYKVLRALLYERPDPAASPATPRQARAPRRAQGAEPTDRPLSRGEGGQAAEVPVATPAPAQAADPVLAEPLQVSELTASKPPADASLPILTEMIEAPAPAQPAPSPMPEAVPTEREAPPRVNWASFAGVAGKRGH